MLPVTAIYAALLALLFLALSARVIAFRGKASLSLGDGGNPDMFQRIRAHSNCAEYVPLGLLLLALAELQAAPPVALHALGALLLVGRALHAWSFLAMPVRMGGRVAGMLMTLAMIGVTALGLLAHALV